ncbi:MAG: prefoldin subunit alpha [Candidatus Methanomethylicaceae archaeon]|nr:prefoldin subunit alpha [Candidatus Verstraetearchaeota archaeon]
MSEESKSSKEELEALILEFSNLKAYADVIKQQIEFSTSAIIELTMSKNSLNEIKILKGNAETLVPIGAGNYIRAYLKDVDTVIVNVGAGVAIEKKIDEAMADIEDKIKKIQTQISTLQNQYTQVTIRLNQLQARINELYPQVESSGQV